MNRDEGRRHHRSSSGSVTPSRARRRSTAPAVEGLEARELLSVYLGPSSSRSLISHGTVFTIAVSGGGYETVHHAGHGQVNLTLYATNPNSTLTITAQSRQAHFGNTPLKIGKLDIKTGLLGTITAPAAELMGRVTTIADSVTAIQLNSIGPNAQLNVSGNVGGLTAGAIALGPAGRVNIGGDLTGPLGGSVGIDGGQFLIDGSASGALQPSDLTIINDGILAVGGSLTGGVNVAGSVNIDSNGLLRVGGSMGGLNAGGLNLDGGGRVIVGGDVTAASKIGGDVNITNNAQLNVGRDFTTGLTVGGNLTLGSGGSLIVGRDLTALTVGGNLSTAGGGTVSVIGNLDGLTVTGALQGQGSTTAIDMNVGLNLDNLQVDGGGAGLGGIQDANISVGKGILGVDVLHGIFNSLITAGVEIDGNGTSTTPTNQTSNVGADGVDAIFDSQLLAGVDIFNLTLGGDVDSDWASNANPTGYRTRIVAGETRDGKFISGGVIDNFQITGSLIDSVVAASVAPSGGNGTLPTGGYGPPPTPTGNPAEGTYAAPAGVIYGGSVSAPTPYDNYTELTYYNEQLQKVSYNTVLSPNVDDFILPGTINRSFASPPLTQAELANSTATTTTTTGGSTQTQTTVTTSVLLPLPTKSTVLGGVISTQHGDNQDFAGIFAADTSGVFIGTLPSS